MAVLTTAKPATAQEQAVEAQHAYWALLTVDALLRMYTYACRRYEVGLGRNPLRPAAHPQHAVRH